MVHFVEGRWTQVRGLIKEQWSNLIQDELGRVAARREQMIGRVQEFYDKDREAAERELDRLALRLDRLCMRRRSL